MVYDIGNAALGLILLITRAVPAMELSASRKNPLHGIGEGAVRSSVRARVKQPFRVLKRQFGYVKAGYRGLAKNSARLLTLFAIGNLFLVRRRRLA